MYCVDFVCTYKQHSEEYQDSMYRSQILQAFSLQEFDDDTINREIEKLYNSLKENDDIIYLLSKIEESPVLQTIFLFLGNDNLTKFKLLFRFELFYLTHKLICEFKNNNIISREIVDSIVKLL